MTARLIAYLLGTLFVAVVVWMPITIVRIAFHAVIGAFPRPTSRNQRG